MTESSTPYCGAAPIPAVLLRAWNLDPILLALLFLAIAGGIESARGLWQDESTLLANFGLPLLDYFGPLPFYDQAAPPLAMVALSTAYGMAGGSIMATRLLLLALNLALFAGVAVAAVRRKDRKVLLAIAMVAVTPLAVRYCVELKQYGFETQASLLFLVALRWLPHRAGLVMALAAVLSFFSYSIMLVVGVAVLDAIVFRFRGPLAWRWLALLVAYTLGWLACYVLLFQPATALQTANYPDAYERLPLADYARNPRLLLVRFQFMVWGQAYIAGFCGLLAALAAFVASHTRITPAMWRLQALGEDAWQPLRVMAALLGLVVLLWLAKLYPVSTDRQFLFLMPIGALLVAHGLVAATEATRSSLAIVAALTFTLVPSAGVTLFREWNRHATIQDTPGLYAFLKRNPDAVVLPDLLFEPTLRAYVANDPQRPQHVAVSLARDSRPMEAARQVLADLARSDVPIRQHVWYTLYSREIYPAYVDWLIGQAHGAPTSIFAAVQFDPRYAPVVAHAAHRRGCDAREAYRSHGVIAYRITCPRQRRQDDSEKPAGPAARRSAAPR